AIGNNTLDQASAGTMANARLSANAGVIPGNGVAGSSLTIQGNGASSGAITLAANASGKTIADQINAASGNTGVTATALTTATLETFTAGTVKLTLQGAPKSDGTTANPVTVSATLATANDLGALTKAINDQTGTTGITAVADLTKGTISLTQTQGYDIGVTNVAGATGVKMTGAAAADGGTGTAVTLTANATATDSAVVGAKITLNSSSAFTAAGDVSVQKAASMSSTLKSVASIDITATTNGVPSGANNALQIIDSALANISSSRASLGAVQNRFTTTISSLQATSENLSNARSRILDTDFAAETANLTRGQILQQAGTAMLAQANSLPNGVLALLRG
ncbi:MAG TPA: flagellin, partial [Burkholderiaceae bacterium]|nr:flagellin [Burkholderiaceae bacterium]